MLTLVALFGCTSGPRREAALGEAYVGPPTLKLRRELGPRAPEVATAKHGDRLEIIGRRRRFVKVRTSDGVVGWTETRQLLSTGQMEALNKLARRAARLPSHGAATVLEPVNVHSEPNRQAPSFHQIREGEHVQVLAQRLAPRVPFQDPSLPGAQRAEPPMPKPKKSPKDPPPATPAPPGPPENWLELSKSRPAEPAKPVLADTWALVRLASGRAGWVLGRMLRMDIPDEVAQYSEGRRITSYFSMGQVNDHGVIKHNWLWTTCAPGDHEYDFDGFRYFVWSLRKHRYETAYIERDLKGYFPVTVHPAKASAGEKTQTMPGFSLVVEGADGVRYLRTYACQVYLVRLVEKTKWAPAEGADEPNEPPAPQSAAPAKPGASVVGRLKQNVRRWLGR